MSLHEIHMRNLFVDIWSFLRVRLILRTRYFKNYLCRGKGGYTSIFHILSFYLRRNSIEPQCKFYETPHMIVSFHNDMVIGDLSSRGQASELLTVLTAWSRHDANLPGIFGALRWWRNVRWGRNARERCEKRKEDKEEREGTACVFTRRVCNAKPDSSSLSERHNYAVIAPSFVIWGWNMRLRACEIITYPSVEIIWQFLNYLALSVTTGVVSGSAV